MEKVISRSESPPSESFSPVFIVVGLLLIINPFRTLYVALSVVLPSAERLSYDTEAVGIVVMNAAYLLLSLIVPVFFVLRKRSAPFLIGVVFLANIAIVAMNGTIAQALPDAVRHRADTIRMLEMGFSGVLFVLWTAYGLSSRKARHFFVR